MRKSIVEISGETWGDLPMSENGLYYETTPCERFLPSQFFNLKMHLFLQLPRGKHVFIVACLSWGHCFAFAVCRGSLTSCCEKGSLATPVFILHMSMECGLLCGFNKGAQESLHVALWNSLLANTVSASYVLADQWLWPLKGQSHSSLLSFIL